MAFYPTSAAGLAVTTYPVGPTVASTAVTAAGSANTKGSYAQLIASTAVTSNTLTIQAVAGTNSVNGLAYLTDIATGAAASETVVIPDLSTDFAVTGTPWDGVFTCQLPCAVASGTRIAARTQCKSASRVINLNTVVVAAGSFTGIASFTNYGADTSDSGQTAVDPGGTVNTKGAYSQLTASSSAVTQSLLFMVSFGGKSTGITAHWSVDIATGAAASEVVGLADLRVTSNDNVGFGMSYAGRMQAFLTYIPASTRIAARASSTTNDATERVVDVGVIAGTAP